MGFLWLEFDAEREWLTEKIFVLGGLFFVNWGGVLPHNL